MNLRTVNVLLVDDDDVAVEGVLRAFRNAKIANPVTVARDGVEALALLRGTPGKAAIAKPYLVLLDLRMPRMGGLEFLAEVRKDPALKQAVIFVLTESKDEKDRAEAYNLNVAGYIVKSEISREFLELTRLLQDYWAVVVLPE